MIMKIFVFMLILILLLTGCSTDRFHVVRDDTKIDIDISYILQDKNFKSLTYDTKTGVVKIENFSSETAELLSQLVSLMKPIP